MIKAGFFLGFLEKNGFTFFAGVPCSIFKEALDFLFKEKRIRYIAASREDIALGIASGAYLAGKRSAILLQNSGLGHIVNALTSFNLLYRIPVLMFISWRGYRGKDAPEHLIMGRKTTALLKCLGIPYRVLGSDFKGDMEWAMRQLKNRSIPVAVIVKENFIK